MGLFENALIIIAGDHGEDFYDRGFVLHNSLNDTNIRPGMIIKAPTESEFTIPDQIDYIDLLPTIAEIIGADIPSQCKGQPIQFRETKYRITERLRSDWYNVAVESNGTKAIFSYDENFPHRPTGSAVADGPVETEFYDVDTVRDGDAGDADIDESVRQELQEVAEEFIRTDPGVVIGDSESGSVNPATEERLKKLGYMS
jgi:arylsulfatase A-like enzyme